eukprot:g44972.t1
MLCTILVPLRKEGCCETRNGSEKICKHIASLEGLSYRQRLDRLGLFSLERQRLRGGLIEVYKIMRGMDMVHSQGLFPRVEAQHQLSDTSSNLALDHNPTMTHQAIVSTMVREVAMGTRMGPSYAGLFMGYVEHSLFQSHSGPHPRLFLQYIDDIIGVASWSHLELEKF